jgi:hypothetical protein
MNLRHLTSLHPNTPALPVMDCPIDAAFQKKAHSGGPVAFLRKQFPQAPDVVCDFRFHCRGHAQRLVYPAKIVVGEMQGTSGLEVVQFLAKGIRQPRESADRLAHGHILPLYVTGRDVPHVRASITYFYNRLDHWGRGIATSGVVLTVVAVELYHLSEVRLSRKHILNAFLVKVEPVCADLKAVLFSDSIAKASEELIGCFASALADGIGGNQFSLGVNRDEHPSIADLWRILGFYMTLFFRDVSPNFIALDVLTAKILHLTVHQGYAALTRENQETENRVAMQLSDAFGATNTRTFDQELNCQQSFFFGHDHRLKQADVCFRECPTAQGATKAAKAVAVLPEFPAFDVAIRAIHRNTIQQPLAVRQGQYEPN